MMFLLQVLFTILGWEAWRWLKVQWQYANERSKGLRWTCPDCETTFGSSDRSIVDKWVVDHTAYHIEKNEEDRDA